ncbi:MULTISPECIES: response regulator transcription factor [unclassified Cryobacterium]|uniref:response regulator transcription factor n=1 Tax=unclassified Cryobacterium TaxID=2649013 RepID=UPI0014479254|nr:MULTISPECIES: response regulator transcription factor [unclassified Cryobacterium]
MTPSTDLVNGRAAYAQRRWADARSAYEGAREAGDLEPEDFVRLATSVLMVGEFEDGMDLLTVAHQRFAADGDVRKAVRTAGWIGLQLMATGELARAAGWLARGDRIAEQHPDQPELRGFSHLAEGLGGLYGGRVEDAARPFALAAQLGDDYGDTDLSALGRLGQGQALVATGDTGRGLTMLDEALVAVTTGEVSPIASGLVYCAVVYTCHLAFDVQRARTWTAALDHWCSSQPDAVVFSGECHAHRATLFRLHGAWDEALAAAHLAEDLYLRGDRMAGFDAYYECGEILRLRGELIDAEESFVRAARFGTDPQPGLALLRLAQGRAANARELIGRCADLADPGIRRGLLPAIAEIALAVGDLAGARLAADELVGVAEAHPLPFLVATAHTVDGAVLLAEGEGPQSLARLRAALRLWLDLDAPYDEARCRMLVARAFRAVGDEDTAAMHLEAARDILAELGAVQALADLKAADQPTHGADGSLTAREVDVLRLVSEGMTNKAIAAQLYLSEKTVARHLSNIFAKLGLSTRSAATAYAYEHQLVGADRPPA